MSNRTIILNREDVNNPLHPYLFDGLLETLGVNPSSDEICLQLSSMDHNKKIENIDSLIEKTCNSVDKLASYFDNVKCTNCGYDGLVNVGDELCPHCHHKCLAWKDDGNPEIKNNL